jgi:peptidoglycan DL-endopeptidase CwlO
MRRIRTWTVLLAALALVLTGPVPAHADPDNPDGAQPQGSLQQQLADASQKYVDAQARVDTAVAKQAQLRTQLATTNQRLQDLGGQVSLLAAAAYRAGPAGNLEAILDSNSPDDFVSRATALHLIGVSESHQLRDYATLLETAGAQQAQLDQEINTAKIQAAEAARHKDQIKQALDVAGGGPTTGVVIPAPSADPAPRNPDGSFPDEKCNQDDPTTTGCLTWRMLHAYQQARIAGFTHYTACWRQSTWGDHPLGRACDFAAAPGGFGGIATGSDRDYGNRLAGWCIANASRLGVSYVIWYHQIWQPAIGWHYYKGDGTPSGDHMNHVHLSIR